MTATNGPALSADRLSVNNDLFLNGLTAGSNSERGALRLLDASITGVFSLRGAQLTATNGPALYAEGLTVNNTLFLDDGFTAGSDSSDGTLRLPNASITGDFFLRDGEVRNTGCAGPVLDFGSAQVDGDLVMSPEVFSSEVGHRFWVDLNGLRYPFIPRVMPCRDWLTLLSSHTLDYAAQPYQQLAAVYRAAGHDHEARQILIAQQRDLRRRGALGGRGREFLHALSGIFIGYGHRPFRALWFLAGVCVLAGGVVLTASLLGLTAHPAPSSGPCSPAENFDLAVDTAIPLLKSGGGQRCEIVATTGWAQGFYVTTYVLHMLGWAFATLFVAGYTGLVRRTT